MTKSFKLMTVTILSIFALNVTAMAQENSGFTVNTVEGSANSGDVENFDPALITNCASLQYGPNDGALCSEAYDEIANTEYTIGCQADYSNKCYQIMKSNFLSVKTITNDCDIAYNSHSFSLPYIPSYQNCKAAINLGYIVTSSSDLTTLNEANTGPYDVVCNDQHGSDCNALNKVDFISSKTLYTSCSNYLDYSQCSDALDLNYGVNDSILYAEALDGTYDASCTANYGQACSGLDKADYQIAKNIGVASANAASDIQQQIADGGVIDGADITIALTSTSSSVDNDINVENLLHVEYLQNCFGASPNLTKIASCSANVDGLSLNQFVVSEIAGGASGTITSSLLQDSGISANTANIATGNTCGPSENQSCLTHINSVLSDDGTFTAAEIETALADYMDGLVTDTATQVATASTSAGCSTSTTTFAVPNPPSICASVNWNCSSETSGITVTYDDNGKGNIVADTTAFSGGAYTVTARLNIGGQTRTRTISGSVNVNQLSAAAGAGYKTGWQPAWWRNYNVIERARNSCNAQGGSLTTYAELKSANNTYGIIGNGTRTIFADANGNASASTSGRAQCSESWPQGPHSLRWWSGSRSQTCKGRAGFGRNFTYVCKDIPCN